MSLRYTYIQRAHNFRPLSLGTLAFDGHPVDTPVLPACESSMMLTNSIETVHFDDTTARYIALGTVNRREAEHLDSGCAAGDAAVQHASMPECCHPNAGSTWKGGAIDMGPCNVSLPQPCVNPISDGNRGNMRRYFLEFALEQFDVRFRVDGLRIKGGA